MAEEATDNVILASADFADTAKNIVVEEAATRDSAENASKDIETAENASKRSREEDPQEDNDNEDGSSKKQRTEKPDDSQQNGAEKSVEEARLDGMDGQEGDAVKAEGEEDAVEGDAQNEDGVGKAKEPKKVGPVKLGPKVFDESKEMFDYFYKFLHYWPLNLNVNKYEHMVLWELLTQGHHEPDKKVGPGIEAFQIRVHPEFQSRCFVLIRKDDTIDDFSYRKCVDSLLPLPENMKTSGKNFGSFDQRNSNKSKQGRGGWGGGRGGGGRGGRHGGNHGRHGGRGKGRGRN